MTVQANQHCCVRPHAGAAPPRAVLSPERCGERACSGVGVLRAVSPCHPHASDAHAQHRHRERAHHALPCHHAARVAPRFFTSRGVECRGHGGTTGVDSNVSRFEASVRLYRSHGLSGEGRIDAQHHFAPSFHKEVEIASQFQFVGCSL